MGKTKIKFIVIFLLLSVILLRKGYSQSDAGDFCYIQNISEGNRDFFDEDEIKHQKLKRINVRSYTLYKGYEDPFMPVFRIIYSRYYNSEGLIEKEVLKDVILDSTVYVYNYDNGRLKYVTETYMEHRENGKSVNYVTTYFFNNTGQIMRLDVTSPTTAKVTQFL
jgi:hypothetical protein